MAMALNNDRERSCTGYIIHDEHIDTYIFITLPLLYEEEKYEELVESDIGERNIYSQPA